MPAGVMSWSQSILVLVAHISITWERDSSLLALQLYWMAQRVLMDSSLRVNSFKMSSWDIGGLHVDHFITKCCAEARWLYMSCSTTKFCFSRSSLGLTIGWFGIS